MYILVYIESTLTQRSEKVVHVCGFVCVCLLSVIFIIKIGIMHLSYNKRAMLNGRFQHHLLGAAFGQMTSPSRCVCFKWSRTHAVVKSLKPLKMVRFLHLWCKNAIKT